MVEEIKKENLEIVAEKVETPKETVEKPLEVGGIKRDDGGKFKTGTVGGPGRAKGSRDFKTIFSEALKKIATEKGIDPDSVEVDLVIRAIAEARKGNFQYHKDIFDRNYGKAQGFMDVTTNGQEIEGVKIEIVKGIVNKPDDTKENNTDQGDDTVREEPQSL